MSRSLSSNSVRAWALGGAMIPVGYHEITDEQEFLSMLLGLSGKMVKVGYDLTRSTNPKISHPAMKGFYLTADFPEIQIDKNTIDFTVGGAQIIIPRDPAVVVFCKVFINGTDIVFINHHSSVLSFSILNQAEYDSLAMELTKEQNHV